jgi:hypothetical protein
VKREAVSRSLRTYHAPGRAAALDGFYCRFLGAGDLAFDVGAHVGDRMLSFRRLGARVVAVEPQRALGRVLRLLLRGDPDVTLVSHLIGARMGEADRYRIPSSLRGDPNDPRNQAMSERIKSYEYVGASGTMSCSASGAGGFTGCGLREIDRAYAEKAQDPGIVFGRLIAAERAKRMAGIDAEAAEVEARVTEFEKGRAEREAKLQAELDAKDAASAEAEPLPEPK